MKTYKELKEENETYKEIIERQKETLETISKLIHNRNEEIAKSNIELRYLRRKINEYENYINKEIKIWYYKTYIK